MKELGFNLKWIFSLSASYDTAPFPSFSFCSYELSLGLISPKVPNVLPVSDSMSLSNNPYAWASLTFLFLMIQTTPRMMTAMRTRTSITTMRAPATTPPLILLELTTTVGSSVVLEVAEVGIIGGVGVADVFTTVVDGVGVADVGGVFTSVVAVGLADIAVVDDIVGVDIGIDEFEGGKQMVRKSSQQSPNNSQSGSQKHVAGYPAQ